MKYATHRMPALLVGLVLVFWLGFIGTAGVVVAYRIMQMAPRVVAPK